MSKLAAIKQAIPEPVKDSLRPLHSRAAALAYAGSRVECPVCRGRFRAFIDLPHRPGAQCPKCRTLERHRLLMMFLRRETNLFDGQTKRLLHVAPERHLQRFLRTIPGVDYLSGDIASPHAMVQLDVTRMDFPDDTFDVVLCSHVLEHVEDDLAAMRELFRVLKPGGWGILDAPVNVSYADTFEDWTITTPEGRQEAFGQDDHVRIFGRNYAELLARPGFDVEVDRYTLAPDEAERFGLRPSIDHVWMCRKR